MIKIGIQSSINHDICLTLLQLYNYYNLLPGLETPIIPYISYRNILLSSIKLYIGNYGIMKIELNQDNNRYLVCRNVEVAEWSKAVDSGSIPKGRGFKSRPQHFFPSILSIKKNMIKNKK